MQLVAPIQEKFLVSCVMSHVLRDTCHMSLTATATATNHATAIFFCLRPNINNNNRLGKCHHPHHPGLCKVFRFWVKLLTEHIVVCPKFNLLSNFALLWGKSSDNCEGHYFQSIISEMLLNFKDILIILSLFYFIC